MNGYALPESVGFALDTEKLEEYADRRGTPTDRPGSPIRVRSCGLGHKRECSTVGLGSSPVRAVRGDTPYRVVSGTSHHLVMDGLIPDCSLN